MGTDELRDCLMNFRPLLWPTLISLPALVILIMLGSWQVQRLGEKTDLIADFKARTSTAAQALPAPDVNLDDVEFQRVSLQGRFDHDAEIFLTGRTYEGNAGFHVVTPFTTMDGMQLLINRGWVSEAYREPETRAFSITKGVVELDGIVRKPQRKGYFVPENEPERGFWFTLKPNEMAAFLQADNMLTSYYVDAVRDGEVITLPIAAEIKIDVPNAHLNYALTWYGLALSLIGVYAAYHHAQGRLTFGRKDDADKQEGDH